MGVIVAGINNFFWTGQAGRLTGALQPDEIDLSNAVTLANTAIIYRIGATGYQSYNPASPTFAPFKTLLPDNAYLIEAKAGFTLSGALLPTDSIGQPDTPVVFTNTLTATGTANTATANGISLVGLDGDELHYNAVAGSQTPCSMNLYLSSVSESNQIAAIGFPAAYAGQRFGYRTGGTLYNGTNLIFTPLGEIIIDAQ